MRSRIAIPFALLLALTASASAEIVTVEMTMTADFVPSFVPAEITIQPGDTVKWVNTDETSLEHVTCSGTGSADPLAGTLWISPSLRLGEWFEYTFEDIGRYEYFSVPHEFAGMFGVITVTSSTGAPDEDIQETTWGLIKVTLSDVLPRD